MAADVSKPPGSAPDPLQDAEVLARMTSKLVHDLKNLVNPLSLYLQLLERQIDRDNAEAHASLSEMTEVVQQSMRVLERLRDFSQQTPSRVVVQPAEIGPAIQQAVESVRAQLTSSATPIDVLVEPNGAMPLVHADPKSLGQALSALLSNAVDAVAEAGGRVTVRASQTDGMVCVQVQDDGPGMSPDVADRAFEPLFSTKGTLGAGLGLSNVYAFARRCGGSVELTTRSGEGTTVVLVLPAVAESADR